MREVVVTYVFGRRSYEQPGYGSDGGSPTDPFVFTVHLYEAPSSWESAYALLGFFRDDFIKACQAAKTSSAMKPLKQSALLIPSCYLDCPTIEVNGWELLLNGKKPNSWLSPITESE